MSMHLNLNHNERPLEVCFNMTKKCHCANATHRREVKGFGMKLGK